MLEIKEKWCLVPQDIVPWSTPMYASSLGNVKNDKRDMNTHRNAGGYLEVYYTNTKGVRARVSVHKLVAACFVQNPYGYKQVIHLDKNKDNNVPENLRWAEKKEISSRINRIPTISGKPCVVFDEEGNVVQAFCNITAMSLFFNLPYQKTLRDVRSNTPFFSAEGKKLFPIRGEEGKISKSEIERVINRVDAPRTKRYTGIVQKDEKGNVVCRFPGVSVIEAELGFNHALIYRCCNGSLDTAYGYKWEYDEETEYTPKKVHKKREKVCQFIYTKSGERKIIGKYEGVCDAGVRTGFAPSGISRACTTEDMYGGYFWKYEKEMAA